MDSKSCEKKAKRPRIGQAFRSSDDAGESRPRFNSSSYNHENSNGENAGENPYRQQRPYQQRPGGYQQRPYGGQGGYQPRPYQPRPQRPDYDSNGDMSSEGSSESSGYQQRPYRERPYGNQGGGQRPGGYQQRPYNNSNQGGQRPGGYQQRPYNNQGGQRPGGYQQRPYNNNQGGQRPGGYQQRPYNNNNQGGQRPGGYQQRPYNNNNQGGQRPYGNNRNQRPGQTGFPARGKSFVPRPKPVEYEMEIHDPDEQIRLNKYMSNAGICSRREADEFIQQGLVKVNGKVVTELGTKITHSDVVEYDEKVVTLQSKCYVLLNKPKDCVTTSDDPNGRTTVLDLVKGACNERIYPVGRLDRNTTGVLLLTNDGDLASKLTHPKFVKKKIYHVWCDRDITEDDMQRIADGIELDDGPIHADAISYATETDRNQAGIEIHSGRNRIVRRIFESLGYHVTKLDRVYFAGLTKKNLPRGRWRYLTQEEVNYLKMGSFE